MLVENCFDLAQFDAIAAHLDLCVPSPKKIDTPVLSPASQVACSIQPLPRSDRSQPCPYDFIGLFCWSQWGKRCFSEGIGDETLGGEVGTMQVAVSQADASDVDFSCDPYRHQFPSVIQQVDLRVLQWATYRERLFSLFILLHTGTNRCLS